MEEKQSMSESLSEVFQKHMEELQEEQEKTQGTLTPEGIVINNDDDAEMVARKFIRLDNEEAAFKEMVKAKLAEFKARRQTLEFLFKYPLKDYAELIIGMKKGKKKSIKLDTATVGFRTNPERTKTFNEDELREWAKVNLPGAFNYDKAPLSLRTVAEWEEANGLAPGREKIESKESFYIKEATRKEAKK